MPESEARTSESQPNLWSPLRVGDRLTIVKRTPEGAEAARYAGEVVAIDDPAPWIVVNGTWTYPAMELDGLSFRPGDQLLEWFSPEDPFNAFAVLTPEGEPRGWYGNVAHPAWLEAGREGPILVWHDLYVDLIGLPDGTYTVRDDDELDASGLGNRDPALYRRIGEARAELIQRFAQRRVPFLTAATTGPSAVNDRQSAAPS
jgi:uncharacterized protein